MSTVKAPRLCWGLDDHGVASHEGRGNLADSQVDGVVEGRDAEHNTQGHLQSTDERHRNLCTSHAHCRTEISYEADAGENKE